MALRAPRRPAALLSWAARHGLRATWFRGQPTALLAARPAVLGRALGVRIDDFRLPGYRVFYASRGGGHVPAPLDAEVAAVGRITSFGQVQSVRRPVGVPPRAGWPPGLRSTPMTSGRCGSTVTWGRARPSCSSRWTGTPPRTWRPTRPGSACPAFADPLPHIGPLNPKVLGESDMDLEVAHAIAPDANLVYVNLAAFGGKNASPAAQFQQAFSTVAHGVSGGHLEREPRPVRGHLLPLPTRPP